MVGTNKPHAEGKEGGRVGRSSGRHAGGGGHKGRLKDTSDASERPGEERETDRLRRLE